jgi:hypothetical protein
MIQCPTPNIFNDTEALRIAYGDDAYLLCFLLGNRDLTGEETQAVAVQIQEVRTLKTPPSKEMIYEMVRYKIEEAQYGYMVFTFTPYLTWETENRGTLPASRLDEYERDYKEMTESYDAAMAGWVPLK